MYFVQCCTFKLCSVYVPGAGCLEMSMVCQGLAGGNVGDLQICD